MKLWKIILSTAFAVCVFAGSAQAKVIITAVSSFPEGHLFSSPFEQFVKEFNEAHGSEVFIDYKGGAPAVGSPFTLGERVQQGQFDLVNITGPYYETTVPAALALILNTKPIAELRKTDWIDAIQEAHKARGLYYLGRPMEGGTFQLYLREPIKSADLSGLRLRVAPHYQPFFGALGATTVRTDLGEVYTLMENGSIDGFGWPIFGFLPDWLKITPYRVEPGFYDTDANLIMNLDTWTKLTNDQKKMFNDLLAKYEANAYKTAAGWIADSEAKMEAAGMKVITLEGEEADNFSKLARKTAWDTVISRDPDIGNRLRKAMGDE